MNLKKTASAALAAAILPVFAGQWISHPGDNALWVGTGLMPKRTEASTGYPAFWPAYSHHLQVDFRKTFDLKKPVTAHIAVKGEYQLRAMDVRLPVKNGVTVFPKGRYDVYVRVFNQQEPPAVKIDGPGVDTDGDWIADSYSGKFPAETFDGDPLASPLKTVPAKFAKLEKDGAGVFGDLGREDFGFLTLKGVKGTGDVRVCYGESREEACDPDPDRQDTWEWVKVRDGDVRLPVSRGWRYVRVVPDPGITVASLAYEREYYPLPHDGYFKCSDARVNEIWRVAEYTLALTFRELPVEGAKRDRWVWSGDAIQSYLMNYYSFGATKPVRDAIWYLRGSEPIVCHINTIMDYTFYWFISVGDYYRYTGDFEFLRRVYPRMRTMADFVIGRLDPEGLPASRSGDWVFVDWAPETLHNYGGVVSTEVILLARAFEELASLGEIVKAKADVIADYRARAAKLRAYVKPHYWDEAKGGLAHLRRTDGTIDPQFTRYPNIFGVLYGYFTPAETERVLKDVFHNDKVMPLQTPYMRFYELEALAKLGHRKEVLAEIKSYWGAMLDLGATTFWELYNPTEKGVQHYAMYGRPYGRSLCHAWGASPVYLLGRYFLGVEPTKPGFAEYAVAPDSAGLAHMEGAVPTPTGVIKVVVDGAKATVVGNGGTGTFTWRGKTVKVPPRATMTLE